MRTSANTRTSSGTRGAAAGRQSAAYQITDWGTILNTTDIDSAVAGDGWAYFGMTRMGGGIADSDLVALNLATGAIDVEVMVDGRPNVQGAGLLVDSSDDTHFIRVSNDAAYLCDYNLSTGTMTNRGALLDKMGQFACRTSDFATLYIGCGVTARLTSYNVDTHVITEHGRMDNAIGADEQYLMRLWTDDTYVYCVRRDVVTNGWWLVVYTIAGGAQTVLHKTDNHSAVTIYEGTSGGGYVLFEGGTNAGWYTLENGGITGPISEPSCKGWYWSAGVNGDTTTWPAEIGYEVDITRIAPDDGTSRIRYRPTNGTWAEATTTGLRVAPQFSKRLREGADGTLMALLLAYNPIVEVDANTGAPTVIGRTGYSLYDILWDGTYWWLFGYPSATFRYDPAQAWDVAPYNDTTNPALCHAFGTYHYWGCRSADGTIFTQVEHERDAAKGSTLGWYNPSTLAWGLLHDPFEPVTGVDYYNARSAVVVNGDTVVCCTAAAGTLTEGKIFVIDAAAKTVTRSMVPMPGIADPGAIAPAGTEHVMGFQETTYYRVNVTTGTLDWTKTLPGTAFGTLYNYECRPTVDADGYIYLCLGTDIYRVDPVTGDLKLLCSAGSLARVLSVAGNRLYILGEATLKSVELNRTSAM